jgi:hypothetical protein
VLGRIIHAWLEIIRPERPGRMISDALEVLRRLEVLRAQCAH